MIEKHRYLSEKFDIRYFLYSEKIPIYSEIFIKKKKYSDIGCENFNKNSIFMFWFETRSISPSITTRLDKNF